MHQHLGVDYDEKVLPSISSEMLKSVLAKFNASQLTTQRQQVSLLVRKELTDRARDFTIILDDVSITELSFGKEYTVAVEAKQISQQEAQRPAFVVERAKQERQQKIVQAEGRRRRGKSSAKPSAESRVLETSEDQGRAVHLENRGCIQNRVFVYRNSLLLNLANPEFYDWSDKLKSKK